MKRVILTNGFVFMLLFCGCKSQREVAGVGGYPQNVGDIAFDESIDSTDFSPCNEDHVGQYYQFSNGLMFENEKPALIKHFSEVKSAESFNGYIIVRFLVNCEGITGRFRVQTVDFEMADLQTPNDLPDKLVSVIKTMRGWGVPSNGANKFDYYQYLTFKIIDGKINEILP